MILGGVLFYPCSVPDCPFLSHSVDGMCTPHSKGEYLDQDAANIVTEEEVNRSLYD